MIHTRYSIIIHVSYPINRINIGAQKKLGIKPKIYVEKKPNVNPNHSFQQNKILSISTIYII